MSLKFRISSVLFPLFCAFGLLLFPGAAAFAQSASVSGRVIDPSSAVVRKAQITFTNLAKGTSQTTQTNDGGFYSLPFVQPGTYTLAVEANGFKRFQRTAIIVTTAQSLVLDVRLQVGDVSQSVTVNGSDNGINTTDASVSTVIDRQFVENMPLNGRSFQSLLTMVPGVTAIPGAVAGSQGEFSVNGQRTEDNYFTVDGVSANTGARIAWHAQGNGSGYSGSVESTTAIGTTQSLISLDALEEFRATTSTYSAEYGHSPGGQFSFSSRAGTNRWHGLVYDYFRNTVLDANNWFNKYNTPYTPRQAEQQNDFGGTFSGPVIIPHLYDGRDKTFFFFSYEGLRLNSPFPSQPFVVPSLSLRQSVPDSLKFMINAFPLPNGADIGDGLAYFVSGYKSVSSVNSTGIRIDHTFNDKFHAFVRYNDVPSRSDVNDQANGQDLAVIDHSVNGAKTITVGLTNALSTRVNNEFRFNFTKADANQNQTITDFGGATPPDLASSLPDFDSKGYYWMGLDWDLDAAVAIDPSTISQRQINVVDTLSTLVGRHELKYGVDYRRLQTIESVQYHSQDADFYSAPSVTAATPDSAQIGRALADKMEPTYMNFAAFVQDEWTATPSLHVSAGVRWEVDPAPKDAGGNNPFTANQVTDIASIFLAPANTPLWKTTYANFAPRVGVAWQLRNEPSKALVLRSGFGIFYGTGSQDGSLGYNGAGWISKADITGSTFPYTKDQIDSVAPPNSTPPYTQQVVGFDPHLKLPMTYQWNLSLQQALGASQSFTLSYVGAAGRRLATFRRYVPSASIPQFSLGEGIFIINNDSSSDYDALQAVFQRTLSKSLQLFASYTWSHNLDTLSENGLSSSSLESGNSDNDIRNNFQAAVTYDVPGKWDNHLAAAALEHWSFDLRTSDLSGIPIDVQVGNIFDPVTGVWVDVHPNFNPGIPLYKYSSQYPGRRIINSDAFSTAYSPTDPSQI